MATNILTCIFQSICVNNNTYIKDVADSVAKLNPMVTASTSQRQTGGILVLLKRCPREKEKDASFRRDHGREFRAEG
jgi:hypothetical protein